MKTYSFEISDKDIAIMLQMIAWGQLEIRRQMKQLSQTDFDIKDYYWFYRYGSNDIKDRLKEIRGY